MTETTAASPRGDMQALLAAIVASSDDAILSTTLDGVITSWNAGAERMYGYSAAQALGQPLALIVPDDRTEEALDILRRVARGERVAHHETVRLTCDGRRIDVLLGVSPVRDAEGRVVGLSKVARDISAEKAAQAQRRQAEERLQLISDNVPALIAYVDRDLRYRFANRAYAQWFGRPHEELIGRRVEEVLGEAAWRVVQPRMARALAGEIVQYEAELNIRDVGHRCIEASYAPHHGGDGRVEGIAVMVHDVSARSRAAQALARSEERLALAVRAAGIGIFDLDHAAGTLHASAELRELLGWTPRQAVDAQALLERVHPLDRELWERGRGAAEDPHGDGLFTLEHRVLRPDGTLRWASARAQTLFEGRGKARRAMRTTGVLVDVSERREAEQALRESRDVLGLAMRAGRMGAWSRELGSGEVWWSRELEELFGLEPGRFGGHEAAFLDLVHPEDRDTVRRAVRQGIESLGDYAVEFRFRHASERWGWMEGRGRAVADADGRPAMLYGLGIDITERKQAEQELQRLNAELQHAARRKDEFLATLAHELRNPLAPMRNALEIQRLRLPGDDAQLRWSHELLQRQLRQLTRLVDDLLEISRITQGRLELRREPLELAEVVQAAVDAAQPLMQARRHAFTAELPDGTLRLVGDAARLTQVLLNLLNNAAQYTPEGGHITLTARREGEEAVLRVRDDGIGLAPEHLPYIFEMFSQVQPALARSHGGLGIGLALVRALAALHGGSVSARSEGLGHGSEFELRLPLPAQPPAEPGPDEPAAVPAPDARRVMVVDDNPDAAESLALLLELQGHEVRTAHDGPGAVTLAQGFGPEVAIVDIGLPGISGYEVARRIRAQDGGRRMLLVALTGWGQAQDKLAALEAGFDRHLTKPVAPEQLDELFSLKKSG
jgi:PAS domain S-box-containing protein